jgi:hypothetical protein
VSLSDAPPKAPVAALACGPPTPDSVSWPRRELHRRLQWLHSHAVLPPRTAFRGRELHRRPWWLHSPAGSPAQDCVSRLNREVHRSPQWLHSRTVLPPRTALRGFIGISIEDEIQHCGTHTCIWLGPLPPKFSKFPLREKRDVRRVQSRHGHWEERAREGGWHKRGWRRSRGGGGAGGGGAVG